MNRLDTDIIVDTDRGTDVIEMQPGQCVVIQCNHNIGTTFIRSLTGEDASSCCRVSYRGELLPLAVRRPSSMSAFAVWMTGCMSG